MFSCTLTTQQALDFERPHQVLNFQGTVKFLVRYVL